MLALLTGLAGVAAGQADVVIDARVSDDLRTVAGTMALRGDRKVQLVDPLALLPDPPDDLQGFRTFPGRPDHGTVTWTVADDGTVRFQASLPRRFGDVGATRHGLMANGAWYPQPLVDDGVPVLDWKVTVTLPEATTGALGGSFGTEQLSWTGTAERAALAVVRRGHLTDIDGTGVVYLSRGRPGARVVRELERNLTLVPVPLDGVVVEAPLRRRLVRDGPGLGYLSVRAFRLTPGLEFAHRAAVTRGLIEAWLAIPDPFERELAAAGIARVHAARLAGLDADRLLGFFRWVPQVNALLSSRRIAFYSEILDRVHPGDPVRDDLLEILDPHSPGTAVAAQLDARYGEGTALKLAGDLWMGETLHDAAERRAVDAVWLDGWRAPYPDQQDYTLDVDRAEATVTVTRDAPEDAPREAVVLRIDDEERGLLLAPGRHEIELAEAPSLVRFDPERATAQRSRTGESWPPRYDVTLSGWIEAINLTQAQLFASGWMTLRRQYDTRNLFLGSLSNSQQDLVSVDLGYLRRIGPLIDGLQRQHRLRWNVGSSLLDPRFADTDGLQVAVDGWFSYAWDTRVSGDFPLRGRRIGAAVGGGSIPGTIERWADARVFGTGIASFHPRHAIATRGSLAVATSTVPHRLLILGGSGVMRSIPTLPACPADPAAIDEAEPCAELATERAVAMLEYRWAPLRNLSVPMAVMWGSELQLAAGVETLAARVGGEPATAVGVTAGVLALADMLGVQTSGAGVTLAWPVWWRGLDQLEPTAVPEVYLKFSQAF